MAKGQFFIISAVIMVTTLLAVYAIYQGYYAIDTSEVQGKDEGFLLQNIESEAKEIFNLYANDSCDVYKDAIGTFQLSAESQARQRGLFLIFNPANTKGCMWTNFSAEVRTRNTQIIKKWNMNITYTPGKWGLDSQQEMENPYENSNIDTAGGTIRLVSTATSGSISFATTSTDPDGGGVWWFLNELNSSRPAGTTLNVRWKTNATGGGWVTYNSFDQLPDQRFTHLNVTFELSRPNTGADSPSVAYSNTSWAYKPCRC